MKNPISITDTEARGPDLLDRANVKDKDWMERTFGLWYRFTMPAQPPQGASFVQREINRRARLTSTIGLFFLIILLIFLVPSFATIYNGLASLAIIAIVIFALIMNKAGNAKTAGTIIVLIAEFGMVSAILIKQIDVVDLPLYDLFVINELLAVSLLPTLGVFILAGSSSIFVVVDLLYQPHTSALGEILQAQFITIAARPIGIQLISAAVLALWVGNTTKANNRANRAEMVATVEHALAEQNAVAEKEKQELEDSIQQLIQAHVDATNGQINAHIPYPASKVLWPLVGVFNALWTRLQHSQQNERMLQQNEHILQQLRVAIAEFAQTIQQAAVQAPLNPLHLKRSGTEVDVLVHSVKNLHDASREMARLQSQRDM